ncbi:unnamed protein product [Diamesa hyperborea]
MVFTVKKFFCLSLKTGANIAGLFGILVCSLTGYNIAQQKNQKPGGIFSASCFTLLYAFVSILLLVGVNRSDHKIMVPWMLLEAVVIVSILIITIMSNHMGSMPLVLFLAYSLLCVWSLFIKIKEDAEKNEADASIEFYSEPRQFVLDSPQNYVFPVPQQNSTPQPLDDLPPSYESVIGSSAPPPRVVT